MYVLVAYDGIHVVMQSFEKLAAAEEAQKFLISVVKSGYICEIVKDFDIKEGEVQYVRDPDYKPPKSFKVVDR